MLPPKLAPLSLSVNLSPLCLHHPELLHWLEQALRLHAVAPSQLSLEIVETALLDVDFFRYPDGVRRRIEEGLAFRRGYRP
mgnify:CR=1 FL=1